MTEPPDSGHRVSRRDPASIGAPNIVIVAVPVLLVLVTYLFWRQTWFGTRLTKLEMGQYLTDISAPHKTQHALSQLAAEMARGDPHARQWYPQLLKLAESSEPQFRLMSAWVMGQDNKSSQFHAELLKLVQDPVAMVRWNAALALLRFHDRIGEPQFRLMLRPYHLTASQSGQVSFSVKEGDSTRPGSLIAHVRATGGEPVEIRSPLTGAIESLMVRNGAEVKAGDEIVTLTPGEEQVWEALRALYLVGCPDELEDVKRFAHGVRGMPERVRQQALLTAEMIRTRAVTTNQ